MSDESDFDGVLSVEYPWTDLVLELYSDKVEAFDATTGKCVKVLNFQPEQCVRQIITATPNYLAWRGEDDRTYELLGQVIEKSDTATTNDEYILELQYDAEIGVGGHFGWYGWGLFRIETNKIHQFFFQEAEKLSTGWMANQGEKLVILLGYYDGQIKAMEVDSTVALSTFNPQKASIWDIKAEQGIHALKVIKDMVVSTHKNGLVQVRDLHSAKLLQSVQVSESKITCLSYDEQFGYVGTWDGMAASLDLTTWEVRWKTQLCQMPLSSCSVLKMGVYFVDSHKGIFHLDSETGSTLDEISALKGVASAPVQFKDWLLIGGAEYVLTYLGPLCIEAHHWEDNLIRSICLTPQGILLGNDNGHLSLWTYPGLIVQEKRELI
jgi:hypothetical protein